jgi:hypothetical protein
MILLSQVLGFQGCTTTSGCEPRPFLMGRKREESIGRDSVLCPGWYPLSLIVQQADSQASFDFFSFISSN